MTDRQVGEAVFKKAARATGVTCWVGVTGKGPTKVPAKDALNLFAQFLGGEAKGISLACRRGKK